MTARDEHLSNINQNTCTKCILKVLDLYKSEVIKPIRLLIRTDVLYILGLEIETSSSIIASAHFELSKVAHKHVLRWDYSD